MKKRPPKTDKASASKKKTMAYLMGAFIILIMIASALNLWKGETETAYEYHGLKFMQTENGLWVAYKDNQQIVLDYNPEELEEIELPVNVGLISNSQKIYISTDNIKTNARAMDYFKKKIGITQNKVYACTEDVEGCEELPLKNCDDADLGMAVVVFKRSEETKITYKANCLTMEGMSENLIKAIDKLYFELIGV